MLNSSHDRYLHILSYFRRFFNTLKMNLNIFSTGAGLIAGFALFIQHNSNNFVNFADCLLTFFGFYNINICGHFNKLKGIDFYENKKSSDFPVCDSLSGFAFAGFLSE